MTVGHMAVAHGMTIGGHVPVAGGLHQRQLQHDAMGPTWAAAEAWGKTGGRSWFHPAFPGFDAVNDSMVWSRWSRIENAISIYSPQMVQILAWKERRRANPVKCVCKLCNPNPQRTGAQDVPGYGSIFCGLQMGRSISKVQGTISGPVGFQSWPSWPIQIWRLPLESYFGRGLPRLSSERCSWCHCCPSLSYLDHSLQFPIIRMLSSQVLYELKPEPPPARPWYLSGWIKNLGFDDGIFHEYIYIYMCVYRYIYIYIVSDIIRWMNEHTPTVTCFTGILFSPRYPTCANCWAKSPKKIAINVGLYAQPSVAKPPLGFFKIPVESPFVGF